MKPSVHHQTLGTLFFDEVQAASFAEHTLRFRNQHAATSVGLDTLSDDRWIEHMGRFEPFEGSLQKPLALRYHGHQFGHYNPAIGDGRGFLFAQFYDHKDRILDLGTKGSGVTPWSRGGDGRLTLQGAVREVLAAERLEALGVPTSRALSVIETGEALMRGDEPSPARSAVLVRLSHSHIRIGTFQRLAFFREKQAMERLVEHCLTHYLPETNAQGGAPALLQACAARLAELTAAWMVAGFVHGVLNTDNLNITGESFDYGPWRFVPTLDPALVAAYFDHGGRYAFARQADAVFWALQHLAGCLLQVGPEPELRQALLTFSPAYESAFRRRMLVRMGIIPRGDEFDDLVVELALSILQREQVDYDAFFSDLRARDRGWAHCESELSAEARQELDKQCKKYDRVELQAPQRPFQDLHDHHYRPIWTAIADDDDWGPFEQCVASQRALGQHVAPLHRVAAQGAAPNLTESLP
ncbi:MAG TPA: YdiU family protein [Myxococcales bacterium]|nr:YdiU family protein [Myxococcales bacterium]